MIALAPGHIVDEYGKPIKRQPEAVRKSLEQAFAATQSPGKRQQAKYDAAGDSTEFQNYWAASDSLDADSANSRQVREHLVKRSRYDTYNNGYSDGIAQTYATDLIRTGPSLRMQTGSEAFNRMVEMAWWDWCKKVQFRRKLWTMAHAKHVDGEAFGILRRNESLNHRVKLNLVLHETEQVQTPYLPYGKPGYIDGVEFDRFGNATFYDVLEHHPGSNQVYNRNYQVPEKVSARFVAHWFKLRRPGQHRGIPECTSTLNVGAASRRWREAVLAAAENIADFSLFLKTTMEADDEDLVAPFSTMGIHKRMMTALPVNYDAFQPKAEQPTATHAEFSKSLINEQARPKSMPYNKAACDSSSYNYASGRLDHQTYYGQLDVDRDDCNDLVLDPIFEVWFERAIVAYGWFGGDPTAVNMSAMIHEWDWPKHQVADVQSEASATDKRLKNGTASLASVHSDCGMDYEDEIAKTAVANGVTVEQQRQINMLLNLPQHVIPIVTQILGMVPNPTATTPIEPLPEQEEEPANA